MKKTRPGKKRAVEDAGAAIERLVTERRGLADAAILGELSALDPLPPDQGSTWRSPSSPAWQRAYRLVALAQLAAERGLAAAVPPILERMCLGDPGELMRGLRQHPQTRPSILQALQAGIARRPQRSREMENNLKELQEDRGDG